jgi:hypothetical protein
MLVSGQLHALATLPLNVGTWVPTTSYLKAQSDGTWVGSFYIITDVIDKELYSNAPGRIHGTFEYDYLLVTSVMM